MVLYKLIYMAPVVSKDEENSEDDEDDHDAYVDQDQFQASADHIHHSSNQLSPSMSSLSSTQIVDSSDWGGRVCDAIQASGFWSFALSLLSPDAGTDAGAFNHSFASQIVFLLSVMMKGRRGQVQVRL
jgi:hypothetical protein